MKKKISIIIPCLNEEKNIKKIYVAIKQKFKEKNFEVIYVDDDSLDNTQKEILKLNENENNVRYIFRKKDKDLSRSFNAGLNISRSKYVILMDCDLQHSHKDANYMKKVIFKEKLDMVIGSRFLNKKLRGNLYLVRSIISLIFIAFINFFFIKKTTDPLSGFFICKKKIIIESKKNYFLKGYKILFDIIYNSRCNINSKDLQINFKKRIIGKSKLNIRIVILFLHQIIFTLSKKL